MSGRYLIVLGLPAYRSGTDSFEIESAFAQHLRLLRAELGPMARTIVVAGPELDGRGREQLPLATVLAEEGIVFRGLFPASLSRLAFYCRLPSILSALWEEVGRADIVHASPSSLRRPIEFPALLMARRLGKKTISVTDIDERKSAKMNLATGHWPLWKYLVQLLLRGAVIHLQHRWVVQHCSLVLFKGHDLTSDYGRGYPHVKNVLDAAFEARHLITPERLEAKASSVLDRAAPLRTTYFGRLVEYKGVDHMLRAIRVALDLGANVEFRIVGAGDQRTSLEQLCAQLRLGDRVRFCEPVQFGDPLFDLLYEDHVMIAAPLSEDTPRVALDACAAGQALIAYDTYYYRDLKRDGVPVELVKWGDIEALGRAIAALDRDRELVVERIRSDRSFAELNTQEAWLERRVQWTRKLR